MGDAKEFATFVSTEIAFANCECMFGEFVLKTEIQF